jgi:hypothetical protein
VLRALLLRELDRLADARELLGVATLLANCGGATAAGYPAWIHLFNGEVAHALGDLEGAAAMLEQAREDAARQGSRRLVALPLLLTEPAFATDVEGGTDRTSSCTRNGAPGRSSPLQTIAVW